jgi:uncharacterized tellurite resistance protein B-like protein
MLRKIQQYFQDSMSTSATDKSESAEHKRQLAAAALFIEVLRSDYQQRDEEWAALHLALKDVFGLNDKEIRKISSMAEREVSNAISMHGFTSCINKHYSNAEKVILVEMLWRIALADGVIDKHENHVMRKIAALLYIPHKDYVRAKQQARLHRKKLVTQ